MQRFINLCLLFASLLTLLLASCASAWAAPSFILGVLPIHSARILADRYEPMRSYLEKTLGQPVRIESAGDFRRFHGRTLHGDFDLTITPAHFARLAQTENGFQPVAQYTPSHDALLVYSSDRPLRSVKDLQGEQLSVIDRLALTVTATLQYLDSQGLEADRDYKVVEHHTHSSAAYSLICGLSVAAVTTSQGLVQMPDDTRNKLVIMKHIADIPAFIFIVKPDANKARVAQLKRALLAFPGEAEGIDFLGRTGYNGIIPVSKATMKRADVFLKETRKALK